eukprot:4057561-Pleurochrysis_carterae.AAC.1
MLNYKKSSNLNTICARRAQKQEANYDLIDNTIALCLILRRLLLSHRCAVAMLRRDLTRPVSFELSPLGQEVGWVATGVIV